MTVYFPKKSNVLVQRSAEFQMTSFLAEAELRKFKSQYIVRNCGTSSHRLFCVRKQSKKISNDQELIQSDPTSCPQNQKGNN